MNYTLQRILKSIREAQAAESTKLSKQQMVAVLHGITGFSSAIFTSKTSDEPQGPFAYIETALVIIDYDTNKQCRAALDSVVKSAEKWLTFGQYRPLEDSSDLNFDLIDVSSVTDIMQVWFMVLNSFGRLHCYKFVPLSLLYYSSFLFPFSFSLSLSGKERELASTSLEFEYLHQKSRCEMLIGGDDISSDVINLGTCFSMSVYIRARFCFALTGGNLTAQSTGSHRRIGGGIQIPET